MVGALPLPLGTSLLAGGLAGWPPATRAPPPTCHAFPPNGFFATGRGRYREQAKTKPRPRPPYPFISASTQTAQQQAAFAFQPPVHTHSVPPRRLLTQRARSDMYSWTIRLVRLRPPRLRHREPPQPAIDLPSPRHDTDTVSSISINHQKHEYFRSVRLLLLLLLLAIYRNGFSLYRNVSARTSKGSHPAAQRGRWACALERVGDFQQPALSLPSITQSARATRGGGAEKLEDMRDNAYATNQSRLQTKKTRHNCPTWAHNLLKGYNMRGGGSHGGRGKSATRQIIIITAPLRQTCKANEPKSGLAQHQ